MKKLFTLLIFFGSISLVSETSEQYVHRSEFFFCNFNDGKSYSDLLAEQAPYEDFLKEKGHFCFAHKSVNIGRKIYLNCDYES